MPEICGGNKNGTTRGTLSYTQLNRGKGGELIFRCDLLSKDLMKNQRFSLLLFSENVVFSEIFLLVKYRHNAKLNCELKIRENSN